MRKAHAAERNYAQRFVAAPRTSVLHRRALAAPFE
jgi:hypothetical protein